MTKVPSTCGPSAAPSPFPIISWTSLLGCFPPIHTNTCINSLSPIFFNSVVTQHRHYFVPCFCLMDYQVFLSFGWRSLILLNEGINVTVVGTLEGWILRSGVDRSEHLQSKSTGPCPRPFPSAPGRDHGSLALPKQHGTVPSRICNSGRWGTVPQESSNLQFFLTKVEHCCHMFQGNR